MDDLHNLTELIEELEGISVKTSQGSFIKMEDARRLIEKRSTAKKLEEETKPTPKNMHEAKAGAAEFLKKQGFGQKNVPEPGRSLPATEPQPSSRT